MLKHLRVRNLGVLEDAEIDPGEAFTVITGETGAGKTLLLGALRLLTGDKSRPDAVGPFTAETQADGLFDDGPDELGVSRVVPRDGRSRAYLEGSLVSAGILEARVGKLVEIVGQHDQLRLRRPAAASSWSTRSWTGRARNRATTAAWKAYRGSLEVQKTSAATSWRSNVSSTSSPIRHGRSKARLQSGDDEAAEQLASRLSNAEAIRTNLPICRRQGRAHGRPVRGGRVLVAQDGGHGCRTGGRRRVGRPSPTRSSRCCGLLRDCAEEVQVDPETLAEVEDRLTPWGISSANTARRSPRSSSSDRPRRPGPSMSGLLERSSIIDAEVAGLGPGSGRRVTQRARSQQREIGRDRRASRGFGMPRRPWSSRWRRWNRGRVEQTGSSCYSRRTTGSKAGRIEDVASGGELSRLVLALRLATNDDDIGTLVFDEVDAGVGGATALALGRKLADLARGRPRCSVSPTCPRSPPTPTPTMR